MPEAEEGKGSGKAITSQSLLQEGPSSSKVLDFRSFMITPIAQPTGMYESGWDILIPADKHGIRSPLKTFLKLNICLVEF